MKSILISISLLIFQGHLFAENLKNEVIAIKLDLSSNGHEIAFDKKIISVPFGKEINITYANKAEMSSEIIHNIAIIEPGKKEAVFKFMQEHQYDLDKLRKHKSILVVSETLSPGSSATISFKPKVQGTYTYVCLMPGHGDLMGMTGTLKVE